MATSTNLVSGLSSGFDWRSMVDQLIAIDHRQIDLVATKQTDYSDKLVEWQGVNTKLLALKTAASALGAEDAFNLFKTATTSNTSTAASNILTVSTSSAASMGIYNILVNQIARAEKISSDSYSTKDTALSLSGDILISGKVVNVVATDTLVNIRDKINAVNTGSNPSRVTASIIQHTSTDYHLVLTSNDTGSAGINILEGSLDSLLQGMGFITSNTTIKNTTSDGAKTDMFSSSDSIVGDLLELTSPPGITQVHIGGEHVDIDLSMESLTTIAQHITLAGISASVVSEEVDGEIKYRIDISGTTSFIDNGNVLQTLGILKGTYGTETEVHAGTVVVQDGAGVALSGTPATLTTLMTALKIGGVSAGVLNGDKITISGTRHDGTAAVTTEFIVGGGIVADHDGVDDLLTHIQSAFDTTVTASFVAGKITITDSSSGDSQLEVSVISDNFGGGTLDFGEISVSTEGRDMQIAAGEGAEIVVDNVTVKKSSNTITDLIEGVTLNLVGESASTTVTINIQRDVDGIKSNIQKMVTAYNTIMDYVNAQFAYDEETKKVGGLLFGDGTLSTVKSDLIGIITQTVTGLSSSFNRLPFIGIALDDKAKLAIDNDKLTAALESNFEEVKKIFIADGSSPSSLLQYVGHTDDTEGGAYDVVISTAATRTTVTGATPLAGALLAGETVSIQDFATGRTATIALTTDMDLDDIVNTINSELNETYTEKLVGSENTGFTAATLFSAIGAGAENGDVITFSGKRPNGLSVSGSYTVDTADTLSALLSEIEDMFEGDVTAGIESGKLVITDRQEGDSQLTFTINTSSVTGLDFGTVDVDPTGADGSQEGRTAIPVTASKGTGVDANKLILTHNTYGTGHILIVSESDVAAPLGLNTASQVYGVNVAGTINSATATGSGQTLSLSSSGNNADGLSVTYTGTGATTSNFTLSLGIGDLMDRLLGFITDSTDGYVGFKQTSLQDSIDSYETRMTQMEAMLERKGEMLINRFVAMEMALSKLQTQSSWLSSQISMLSYNYGR